MSNSRYLEPAVPIRPGEVSYEYRDTRTGEVSHPFSLWELHQLKDHHLPDYREAVWPAPRPGEPRERLTLYGTDGRVLNLERPFNETTHPTDNKGRLGRAIGREYFDYYTVKLRWDLQRVELRLRNAFLVKTWHERPYGWNVEVKFREVDYTVLSQPHW